MLEFTIILYYYCSTSLSISIIILLIFFQWFLCSIPWQQKNPPAENTEAATITKSCACHEKWNVSNVRCEWCVIYYELFYSERLYPELFYSEHILSHLTLSYSELPYSELLYISVIRIFGNQTSFDKRKLHVSCPSRTDCFWSVLNIKIGHVNRNEHPRFF